MHGTDLTRLLSLRSRIEEQMPEYLRGRRWFGGKARRIAGVRLADVIPFDNTGACLWLLRVQYEDGGEEIYSAPMMEAAGELISPGTDGEAAPQVHVTMSSERTAMFRDAMSSKTFLRCLLEWIRKESHFRGEKGAVHAQHGPILESLAPANGPEMAARPMRAEQSNSSVLYGERLVLKLFRRLEEGINPEIEIGRYLTDQASFRNVPPLAGYLEYRGEGGIISLGMLQSFVPNRGDAWQFTLHAVGRYFERVRAAGERAPAQAKNSFDAAFDGIPSEAEGWAGGYLNSARLLGRRTAELHLALASARGDAAFDPEPSTQSDQQALCRESLQLLRSNFELLRRQAPNLAGGLQEETRRALDAQPALEGGLENLRSLPLTATRIRIHGDYHLGQVLVSGDDFVIIDFEGEPARPLAQRRAKRSPLQDVAGMLRSFHYAAYAPLIGQQGGLPAPALAAATPWASAWQGWVSAAFLRSYLETAGTAPFLPRRREELSALLRAHMIEKAAYELGYELNNRPEWVRIPLSGIAQLAPEGSPGDE